MTRALLASLMLALTFTRAADAQPKRAEARAVYVQGKAAYERGEYSDALAHFEEAYRLNPVPALLFNMAQAHRLSGAPHCQQALDLYRQYLAADPKADNRVEAAERIDEMRACVARLHAETIPAPPPTPAPAPLPGPDSANSPSVRSGDTSSRAVPPKRAARNPLRKYKVNSRPLSRPAGAIVVTGVGAALGVAGVILYARARAKFDEVERSCPCAPGSFSNWETLTTVSYGLMAVGAVGTASGVSWYLLAGESGNAKPRGRGRELTLYLRGTLP